MTDQMTPRERWLAAVRLQPVDRLPFWPKLDAVYPKAQDAPFREMALDAVHDWIGSDKHTGIPGCTREVRTRTAVETTRDNGTMRTISALLPAAHRRLCPDRQECRPQSGSPYVWAPEGAPA